VRVWGGEGGCRHTAITAQHPATRRTDQLPVRRTRPMGGNGTCKRGGGAAPPRPDGGLQARVTTLPPSPPLVQCSSPPGGPARPHRQPCGRGHGHRNLLRPRGGGITRGRARGCVCVCVCGGGGSVSVGAPGAVVPAPVRRELLAPPPGAPVGPGRTDVPKLNAGWDFLPDAGWCLRWGGGAARQPASGAAERVRNPAHEPQSQHLDRTRTAARAAIETVCVCVCGGGGGASAAQVERPRTRRR
jgi:hypothetical protein